MNKLLCKLFIKNYEDTKNNKVRENYGKFAGIVGIISNVLLCVAKIVIGTIANSIAIIADGINNLADASSSLITLVGFKLAAMPEDDEHPYGHARIEYIAGMIVSMIIMVVGIELGKSSFEKILHPEPLDFSIAVIAVLVLAIIIKAWQCSFNISLGKRINSITLIATGTDSRNDVISTTAVLVSVLIGKFTDLQIDGYMGLLVALFILWSGICLVKETISPLLGETPDPELVNQISSIAMSFDGVLGIHDLVVHNYGPGKIFASIHIEVDSKQDLMESHDIIDNIEKKIESELHIHITGHLDPIRIGDPLTDQMLTVVTEEVNKIDGLYNVHDLRVVPGTTHTNIIFDVIMGSDCKVTSYEAQCQIQRAITAVDSSCFVVINFDKPYIRK